MISCIQSLPQRPLTPRVNLVVQSNDARGSEGRGQHVRVDEGFHKGLHLRPRVTRGSVMVGRERRAARQWHAGIIVGHLDMKVSLSHPNSLTENPRSKYGSAIPGNVAILRSA